MPIALPTDGPPPATTDTSTSDSKQPFRPGSFANFASAIRTDPSGVSRQLDHAFQMTFHNISGLNSLVNSTRYGKATVTGNLLQFPTGLARVDDCTATIDNGAVAHNFWISVQPSKKAGCIDIYVWKPTAAGNNTPVAATTAVSVRWSAKGST